MNFLIPRIIAYIIYCKSYSITLKYNICEDILFENHFNFNIDNDDSFQKECFDIINNEQKNSNIDDWLLYFAMLLWWCKMIMFELGMLMGVEDSNIFEPTLCIHYYQFQNME